jgi:hypothetical protein
VLSNPTAAPLFLHPCSNSCSCLQTNEAEAVDTEAQMKAAAAEEAGGCGGGSAAPEELVPAEVNGELLAQMEAMVGGGTKGGWAGWAEGWCVQPAECRLLTAAAG